MAINTVTVTGNLTRDAELRGDSVLSMRVAVNNQYYDKKADDWADDPLFIDAVRFGNVKNVAQYLTKGTKVCLTGRLQQNDWEDQDGNERTTIEIVVTNMEFMSPASDEKPARRNTRRR